MRRWIGSLALLVLLVTGCETNGTEPPADPRQAVIEAAERTVEEQTARVATTFEHEGNGFAMTMTSEGVIDFANDRAELTMEIPGAPEGTDGAITMIADGDVFYTQIPTPDAPAQWVRMDAAQMAGAPEGMGGAGGQNPGDSLGYLHGISDVTEADGEEVRGTQTTRYDGTVDLEQAVEEAPEDQRDFMRQSIEMLGTSEMPVSVWIDGDGLIRRMTYEMDLSQAQVPEDGGAPVPEGDRGEVPDVPEGEMPEGEMPEGAEAPGPEGGEVEMPEGEAQPQLGRMTVTMELFDFGVEADITPPPEEEVTDFGELGVPGPEGPEAPAEP